MGSVKHIKREQAPTKVRYVDNLTIYFATGETIFVTDGKVSIVMERWFEGRGHYKDSWKPFTRILERRKSFVSVYEVWQLATNYGVSQHQTFRFPEIKKGTKVIKEKNENSI